MGLCAKFLRFGAKNPDGSYIDAQTQLCWVAYRLGVTNAAAHFIGSGVGAPAALPA